MRVLIVGGGIGGLCLAQGLRQAGLDVRVFERDADADTRGQGYRLRIDPTGTAALARCLPEDLFRLFEATTNPPLPPQGAAFDHQLRQVAWWGDSLGTADRARLSTVANRRTLREVLLAGLDCVEFGREVVAAHDTGDAVLVEFADGHVETGDLVVAADGINSTLRAQLLPHAQVRDTGLRGIYGHAILDAHLRDVLPPTLLIGSPPVLGPDATLAIGTYCPVESPQRAARRLAPYAHLRHVADYMKWTLVTTPETMGLSDPGVFAARPEELYGIARRLTADWHPALRELVRCADPPSTFAVSIRASLPVDPWPTSRVTLLGDAIHATTPAGGTGANVAMRDAAELTDHLTAVVAGHTALLPALATYEHHLREYGFAASSRSLRASEKIFQGRLPALV